ncbi:MAG: 30S ribosomal protein S11 [Nitrospirae bacterium]|nr:30S ribosomal protein S11 [Nitrospirota bacterium]
MAEEKAEKPKKTDKAEKGSRPEAAEKKASGAGRKSGSPDAPGQAEAGEKAAAPEGAPAPRRKKKGKKNVPAGVAHINVTFNNTLVTLTDPQGNVLSWASGGTAGFSGTKKGTPYAATKAAEVAGRKAMDHGLRRVSVLVKGPGPGREAAVQGLQMAGLHVLYIKDVTPIPHNGCRAPKRRRV